MKKYYSKILLGLVFCILIQTSSFAIVDAPSAIQQAGSITNQIDKNLKDLEIKEKVQEDFQNFEKRKNKEKKEEKVKKKKKKVKKARKEDYATEGIYLEHIEVTPSKILTKDEINDIIEEYTQTNVKFEQMQKIVNKLNNLYAEKGFVTARAYLPEQTIKNETIKIVLVEGKVGEVNVSDMKWTRPSYVNKRLNLKKGEIFNVASLEQTFLTFNRYNEDIKLHGSLQAGKEKETTDVTVNVQERLPFKLSILSDNQGRESVGKYRAGLVLRDDSLFGFRDKLTLGSYITKSSVTPFADYNIPINRKDGRIGVSYSYGLSKINNGAYKMFNIESRSHNASAYYTQPLIRKPWKELSSTTSVGFKYSETLFDKAKLYDNKIPYVSTGLNYRHDTKRGIWYLGQNAYFAFPFYYRNTKYLKIDGGLLRLHDFGHGFVGQFRANYQFIPDKKVVPYNDQITAGGMNSVRGYTEGLLIGKDGYILSAELQFPVLPRAIKSRDKSKYIPFLGNFLKGFIFADHAGIFPYKGTDEGKQGYNQHDFLMSLGCGFKINLPKDLSLRIAWGFPVMRNNHEDKKSWGKFHFDLNVTPDFDALLKNRKPKEKKIETVKLPESEQTKLADFIKQETVKEKNTIPIRNKTVICLNNIKTDNLNNCSQNFISRKPVYDFKSSSEIYLEF